MGRVERVVDRYEADAEDYRERHADRSVVAGLVERFLVALDGGSDPEDEHDGREPDRVLDAGCGPGWESATFAEAGGDVVGIDLTAAFLDAARQEVPEAALARMDMRQLGFGGNAFDGVWACASFLHVPREDAGPTLGEFRRVLRPGGTLLLSVKREGDERYFTLYDRDELAELVVESGFAVERACTTDDANGAWVQLLASARGRRPHSN
jgi:SAM-dependent methyltransferase